MNDGQGLVRGIRRWDLVGLFINNIIGAGIFGLPATLFALAGTLYGLTVTLRRAQAGDIAYHLGLLTMQVASAILLLGALRLRRGTPSRG